MDAGDLIREARRQAGLTQTQLARLARTSQPTISAYESGAKEPGSEALLRLLSAAGMKLRLDPSASTSYEFLAGLDVPVASDEDLANAVRRGIEDGDIWLALRDFLDTFARVAPGGDIARSAALFTEEPPKSDDPWDTFVAALAEHLLASVSLPAPSWTNEPRRFLTRWWFPHSRRAFDALAVRDSPAAFRRRGVYICPSMLERC